jgi:hypothetical protein
MPLIWWEWPANARGGVKKEMKKVTYICCGAKQKVVTYSILFLFLFLFFIDFFDAFFTRFVTREFKKHEKKHLGSSQKMCFLFRPFFCFFLLGCLVRFFLSRLWAFRNKGSSKTR